MITIVLGSQWGDEGKGKLVDILCSRTDLCCRAQGGNNAGHTIVTDGHSYDFHILPSGLINRHCKNLVGSGCVVHIPSFFKELQGLSDRGLDSTGRIFISDRAQVVFDLHLLIDGLEERDLKEAARGLNGVKGGGEIGTTGKGIGPTYSTKTARSGVPINQVFDKEEMDQRLRKMASAASRRYGDLGSYDVEAEIQRFDEYRKQLLPFVVDAVDMMAAAQQDDQQRILVEGANALMLDIDHGTYPFVTSSSTGTGGAVTGLGLNIGKVRDIIGVVKAYTTRVGSGPFPTEQQNQIGEDLRHLGREYGATTGRPRRCGWLDLVVLKYSHAVNHYTALNLTKLDVLDSFDTIKVAVAYKLDGEVLRSFPANLKKLERCEVVYEELQGWAVSTTGRKNYDELPELARAYVEYIEEAVGVKITTIGTGPDREAMIYR